MKDGRSRLRIPASKPFALPILAFSLGVAGFTIPTYVASADVEVNLEAIGAPTDADRKIAPGRAPIALRAPASLSSASSSAPVQTIKLTPPPSLRGSTTQTATARPKPTIIEPAIAEPAAPQAPEAQPAAPVSPTESAALTPAPTAVAAPPTPIVTPTTAPTATPVARPGAQATGSPTQPPARLEPQATASETSALTAQISPAPRAPVPTPTTIPAPSTLPENAVAEPKPVQVASLPAAREPAHRVRFEGTGSNLLPATQTELELIATELMRHSDRIEIQAFAGDPGGITSNARRLSLQRGLAVRQFLVDKGVLQSRIDVRALGGVKDSGPTERVDILLSRR